MVEENTKDVIITVHDTSKEVTPPVLFVAADDHDEFGEKKEEMPVERAAPREPKKVLVGGDKPTAPPTKSLMDLVASESKEESEVTEDCYYDTAEVDAEDQEGEEQAGEDNDDDAADEEQEGEEDAEDYSNFYNEDEPGEIPMSPSSDSDASSIIPPPPPPEDEEDEEEEDDSPSDEETEIPPEVPTPVATTTVTTPSKEESKVTPTPSPVTKEDLQKQFKTKVAARLAKALEDAELTEHRSPEIVPLNAKYQALRKRLRSLIASAKGYQKATRKLEEARSTVRMTP